MSVVGPDAVEIKDAWITRPQDHGITLGATRSELAWVKRWTHLEGLFLGGEAVDDDLMAAIRQMPGLTSLNLVDTQVTSRGVELLRHHPSLSNVSLAITKSARHKLGERKISRAAIDALATLRLGGLGIEGYAVDDGATAGLSKTKGLVEIVLCDANIGDDELKAIATFEQVRMLQANDNPGITDAGVISLAQLTNLSSLGIRGTSITVAGLDELTKRLPQFDVIASNDSSLYADDVTVEALKRRLELKGRLNPRRDKNPFAHLRDAKRILEP